MLSSVYAINIANKISKPIVKLIFAAKEVSAGNLDVKLKDEKEPNFLVFIVFGIAFL